jgi:hypothetical protein
LNGQAEKDDYYDPAKKKSIIEEGVPAHVYSGIQFYISGVLQIEIPPAKFCIPRLPLLSFVPGIK